MKVFVINAYPERRSKYNDDYELLKSIWWEDITDDILDKYHFRYNCKIELRKKICACSESHKGVLKKIIDEDLHDVCILEDDCIVKDMELLSEIVKILPEDFVYLGGQINSCLVKDYNTFTDKKLHIIENIKKDNNLIKTIEPEKYRITHACAYYIPNKDVAMKILSSIDDVYSNRKYRAIDVAYHELQKRNIIKYFVFPAFGTLYLPDAKNGFTYSKYKLDDNQLEY